MLQAGWDPDGAADDSAACEAAGWEAARLASGAAEVAGEGALAASGGFKLKPEPRGGPVVFRKPSSPAKHAAVSAWDPGHVMCWFDTLREWSLQQYAFAWS